MEGGIEQNMGMSEQAFLGKTGWELSTLNMTRRTGVHTAAVLQARMPFGDPCGCTPGSSGPGIGAR